MPTITAKSVIFDFERNWGINQQFYMALRSVDFFFEGSLIPLAPSDYTAAATTVFGSGNIPRFIFDTSLSKIGGAFNNTEWLSQNEQRTDQRVTVVFDSPITFDAMVINNHHSNGSDTVAGVRETVIMFSSSDSPSTVYQSPVEGSIEIFNGEIPRHINSNVADPFIVPLILPDFSVSSFIETPYSSFLGASNLIRYGNAGVITRSLYQYYSDANQLNRFLTQRYSDAQALSAQLLMNYTLTADLRASLEQIFSLYGTVNSAFLEQVYSINDFNLVSAALRSIYNIQPDNRVITQVETLQIDGVSKEFRSLEVDRDIDRHCNNADIVLLRREDFVAVDFLQEVRVDVDGAIFNFVVFEKNKSEDVASLDLEVSAASKSILLDFPYAKEVPADFVLTTYSDSVNRLAQLEGQTCEWRVEIDELLDNTAQTVTGLSPIEAIRQITGELKCVALSDPDGQLYIAPRRKVRSNKLDEAIPDHTLSTGIDFISTNSSTIKNTGYNRFAVSPFAKTDRNYTQEIVRVSDFESIVKIYEFPWSNTKVDLITSETDSIVGIERLPDVLTERNCNKVEIVEGSGTTTRGVFVLIDYDYQTSRNLGIPRTDENRSVITSIPGESTVNITYLSRFRQWRVRHVGTLTAQFILVSEED